MTHTRNGLAQDFAPELVQTPVVITPTRTAEIVRLFPNKGELNGPFLTVSQRQMYAQKGEALRVAALPRFPVAQFRIQSQPFWPNGYDI